MECFGWLQWWLSLYVFLSSHYIAPSCQKSCLYIPSMTHRIVECVYMWLWYSASSALLQVSWLRMTLIHILQWLEFASLSVLLWFLLYCSCIRQVIFVLNFHLLICLSKVSLTRGYELSLNTWIRTFFGLYDKIVMLCSFSF